MAGTGFYRRVWLACAGCLSLISVALGQVDGLSDLAAKLYRGQQAVDEGNFQEAVQTLNAIVRVNQGGKSVPAEVIGATRLLAQVYYRSADYASAARLAEAYTRLVPQPDGEVLLILADSNLALGHAEAARLQLEKAAPLINKKSVHPRNVRLAVAYQNVAEAVRQAARGGDSGPASQRRTPGFSKLLDVLSTDYEQIQRFEMITFTVNQYLKTGRLDAAIGLLEREIVAPAYSPEESADLKLQLADCYYREIEECQESGEEKARQEAIATENRILETLAADLGRQRSRAVENNDFLKLLPREGALHERKAELARVAARVTRMPNATDSNRWNLLLARAEQELNDAARCYKDLQRRADEMEYAKKASKSQAPTERSIPPGRAAQYRDVALSGLQRVYDALRSSATDKGSQELTKQLRDVSDDLVRERSARMLDTDPSLYDARRAQASVYASTGENEGALRFYRKLKEYWDRNPYPQRNAQAAVLMGLAEMSRATDKTRDAYVYALAAKKLVAGTAVDDDPISRRNRALQLARIDNSLGVTSIALGEYSDALGYLTSADEELKEQGEQAAELRRQNEQMLLVLSRVKVYRGLLHKAEAQYSDAASRISEGRALREKVDDKGDLAAYYLAEASVRLAQARDLMQDKRLNSNDASVRDALSKAETALAARPLVGVIERDGPAGQQTPASFSYRYLRAVLLRMRGDTGSAFTNFSELKQDSHDKDPKTEAKCSMQLAQLSIEKLAGAPAKATEAATGGPVTMSQDQAAELRVTKLKLRAAIEEATKNADDAVGIFRQIDVPTKDELTVTVLPSLHFQASYLAARLHMLLATVESHILRLDELLSSSASAVAQRGKDRRLRVSRSSSAIGRLPC